MRVGWGTPAVVDGCQQQVSAAMQGLAAAHDMQQAAALGKGRSCGTAALHCLSGVVLTSPTPDALHAPCAGTLTSTPPGLSWTGEGLEGCRQAAACAVGVLICVVFLWSLMWGMSGEPLPPSLVLSLTTWPCCAGAF